MDSPCLLAAKADAGQHSAGRWPRPRQEGGPAVPIRDILRNSVKEKLKRDEVVASMTVRLVRSMEIARIARTAGFDSLYVDIEHSSFSLDTCAQICMAALEAGIAPFVRVPANTPDYVSRVLDGAALNDATMVIVQFESVAALERAEEIVAVDGVDMVLVGLNDLLADWGIPGEYDHPRVREAYAKTIAACRKRGKHCGVGGLATRPDLVAEFVKMGARYVSTGTDLAFLLSACTARAKEVREIKL